MKNIHFQREWTESAQVHMGREAADKLALQILHYALDGEIPDNSDNYIMELEFSRVKPLIDAELKKHRGGAPLGNQNAKKKAKPKKQKAVRTKKAEIAMKKVDRIAGEEPKPFNPYAEFFGDVIDE